MPAPTITASERRLSLAAAICCTAVAGIAMGLTWPLLALILKHQGVTSSMIGLSSATQSLAVFLVAPAAPRLIVRFGLVPIILACVAVTLATLLLLPAFPDVHAWFPIRLALGAGTMTLFVATETWVSQIAPEGSRGRVIGLFGLLWSAGFAAGPMVIGVTGIQGWPPFLVAAALVALAALPLPFVHNLAPAVTARSARRVWPFLQLAPAALLAAPMLGAVDYSLDSFLPVYGLSHGLEPAVAVALLTTLLVGVTAAQFPAGWLADRMDARKILFGATALAGIACLTLTALVQGSSAIPLFGVVAVLGAALGGIWTIAVVLLSQSFRGGDLISAYALSGMLHGIGMVTGPLSIGAAADRWGPEAIPFGVALFCLLYLPFTLLRPATASP
jgi:MFS family permease